MHPISSRCFLAAAALAAVPLIPSALQAQDGVGVSVSFNNDNSSSLTGLDALVAPIALYPDPLLGIMLPASTSPNDLQAAASMSGDSGEWQPAVQDMTHYPRLLQWMASNIDWTDQLGAAFANNPSDVMNAIQDLRQRALADGALQSNGQMLVVNTDGAVQILPQSTDALYVPEYDPNAVFFGRGVQISFGAALPCGDWLGFYPSWHDHAFYTGDFFSFSRDRGGWGAAVRGGAFVHASGFSPSEWHVARDAQIRSMHVNVSKSQSFARPQSFNQHTDYRANLHNNEAAQQNHARTDQARANEQRGAAEQHYAQSQAQPAPRNNERYAQANDQRNSQTNRQTYAQNNPERYAQSNASHTSQETPQRNAQMNDQQRYAESNEPRYAQSNEQRPASPSEQTNRTESHPSTFTGDSMRQSQERSNAARPSEQTKSERPQAKAQEKSESKPSNAKSEDDKKKDQQQ